MNYGKHHINLLQVFSKKKNSPQKVKGEAGLGKQWAGHAIIDDTENSKMPYLFTH